MTEFKKIALTLVALAVITAGTVFILKDGKAEKLPVSGQTTGKIAADVPLAESDNERVLEILRGTESHSSEIRSMAATRTPTPTPTEEPVCTRLSVSSSGAELVVGDEVSKQDLNVRGVFYNGTVYSSQNVTDYDILDPTIYEVGDNEIVVEYQGITASVKVKGKEPLEVVSITARYKGSSIIVSNAINKNDVEVKAHYNWTDKAPEVITNFRLEPAIVENVGKNVIYVYYGNLDPVKIEVTGKEKTITKVEVTYLGGPVYVGNCVDESDIEVLVTYNDGSQDTVDNFQLTGDMINSVGSNRILVTYKGNTKVIDVIGIERPSAIWNDIPGGWGSSDVSTFVTLLVSRKKQAQSIIVSYVPWEEIDACVNRVFYTSNYLGFEITYEDPDAVMEFPVPCRVRVPEDFDPDNFAIYYSPNKETIMARINGEFLNDRKEFYVFNLEEAPGTYIMMDIADGKLVSSINIKEKDVKLRTNRNYSIEAVVLPDTAGNKELSYYSTDPNVATVSDKGKVKTLEPGECDIYVEAMDGSGVYEVIHITVTKK